MNKVELCNLALYTVGAAPITSYDEETQNGGIVRTFYPEVKKRVLRENPWNCAMKRAELAQTVSDPEFGYSYSYQLPSDCVRAIKVNDPGNDFHVERNTLVANVSPAGLLYVADVDEPHLDSHLTRCIQYALAVELANVLASSVELSIKLERQFERILSRAKHIDGQESFGDQFFSGFMDNDERSPQYG